MNRLEKGELSRRERQLLDILYRLGEATAQDVQDELPDPPSYSAVLALLATPFLRVFDHIFILECR